MSEIKYRIRRFSNTDRRSSSKFIIFTSITNLVHNDIYFEPNMKHKNTYYSFGKIKNYFHNRVGNLQLPFHYYVDKIGNDWDVFNGAPVTYRSHWVQNLINNYYISPAYRNAIVVAVQDNYAIDIPENRCFEIMASKIIEPFLKANKANFRESVHWFDEIFDYDMYERDKEVYLSNMRYRINVEKSRYFDRTNFNLQCIDLI